MSVDTSEFANLKEIITFVTAVAAGSFALWRWTVDQRWRRVQYAQTLVNKFLEEKKVVKACEVVDTIGEVQFEDARNPRKHRVINTTDEFLIGAFSTFDDKEENTDDEIAIRDVFDELLGGLSIFQSHIDVGLIKLQDIGRYLEYWIKELSGHGKVHSEKVAHQLYKYIRYFGYERVLTLAQNMGYPFKTGA